MRDRLALANPMHFSRGRYRQPDVLYRSGVRDHKQSMRIAVYEEPTPSRRFHSHGNLTDSGAVSNPSRCGAAGFSPGPIQPA